MKGNKNKCLKEKKKGNNNMQRYTKMSSKKN